MPAVPSYSCCSLPPFHCHLMLLGQLSLSSSWSSTCFYFFTWCLLLRFFTMLPTSSLSSSYCPSSTLLCKCLHADISNYSLVSLVFPHASPLLMSSRPNSFIVNPHKPCIISHPLMHPPVVPTPTPPLFHFIFSSASHSNCYLH